MAEAKVAKLVNEPGLALLRGLKIRILITQTYLIVDEVCHNGVLAIGQHKPHLAILLGYDGHHAQIVYVDIASTQKIIDGREKYLPLMVSHSKLAILLKYLMI